MNLKYIKLDFKTKVGGGEQEERRASVHGFDFILDVRLKGFDRWIEACSVYCDDV